MDIKFETEEGIFSVRVRALIISDNKLLAMHDEISPYYYLVGGKVGIGETAEDAVLREVREELEINAEIIRPVFLAQGFYTDDINGKRYHEIVLYYLLDISKTELLSRGDKFVIHEGKHTLSFEWLDIEGLEDKYFYPNFIKTEVKNLPNHLKFVVERE